MIGASDSPVSFTSENFTDKDAEMDDSIVVIEECGSPVTKTTVVARQAQLAPVEEQLFWNPCPKMFGHCFCALHHHCHPAALVASN